MLTPARMSAADSENSSPDGAQPDAQEPAPPTAAPFRVVRVYRVPTDWRAFSPDVVQFDDDDDDEPPEHTRHWTLGRIFTTLLIVLTLAAFLAYTFSGLFTGYPPAPLPPPTRPLSLI